MKLSSLSLAITLICAGCEVQRTLTVQSNPPGSLVFLNDQEIGRTPVTRNFKWYGTYDVELRAEGYQTVRTQAKVWAPWWQWVPFDLVAAFIPGLEDHHDLTFALHRPTEHFLDPQIMINRGETLRGELESSEKPHKSTTQPAEN